MSLPLPELAPYYYRDNYLSLCDTVVARYGDLLSADEHSLLARFRQLENGAQCLYVRLISRVGPWFRTSKLAYAEIGQIEPALTALLNAQLIYPATGLSPDELARLYTRPQLRDAYAHLLPAPLAASKQALIAAIDLLALTEEQNLAIMLEQNSDRIISPAGQELVQLLQLLYFGNLHQSLTDFVLSDLGIAQYYPYPLDPGQRLFSCRQAVDEYLTLRQLSDTFYELRELDDWDDLAQLATEVAGHKVSFSSSWPRWQRLCNTVARQLERQQQWDLALQLYAHSQCHPARERRARILLANEDWQIAVDQCQDIILAPWCEAEREAAERILPRALRKLGGKPVQRRAESFEECTLTLTADETCVEQAAATYLQQQGQWQSVHFVENDLINALFGLAFWQQIFADIPGVFHNPYQGVPTDMYSPEFSKRREKAITQRLAALHRLDLSEELLSAHQQYGQYRCHWTNWRRLDQTLVATALQIIPASHLLAIWQRQLFDPGENRSGLPDLIAFGQQPGQYCLIEVKGPGDKLQDNQKRWLRYFEQCNIPAQVAWVEWTHG